MGEERFKKDSLVFEAADTTAIPQDKIEASESLLNSHATHAFVCGIYVLPGLWRAAPNAVMRVGISNDTVSFSWPPFDARTPKNMTQNNAGRINEPQHVGGKDITSMSSQTWEDQLSPIEETVAAYIANCLVSRSQDTDDSCWRILSAVFDREQTMQGMPLSDRAHPLGVLGMLLQSPATTTPLSSPSPSETCVDSGSEANDDSSSPKRSWDSLDAFQESERPRKTVRTTAYDASANEPEQPEVGYQYTGQQVLPRVNPSFSPAIAAQPPAIQTDHGFTRIAMPYPPVASDFNIPFPRPLPSYGATSTPLPTVAAPRDGHNFTMPPPSGLHLSPAVPSSTLAPHHGAMQTNPGSYRELHNSDGGSLASGSGSAPVPPEGHEAPAGQQAREGLYLEKDLPEPRKVCIRRQVPCPLPPCSWIFEYAEGSDRWTRTDLKKHFKEDHVNIHPDLAQSLAVDDQMVICPMELDGQPCNFDGKAMNYGRHVIEKHIFQPKWVCPVPGCTADLRAKIWRKELVQGHLRACHMKRT
ncbi:hypothetical protein NM688_g7888 [Phlebia brevispora]|uniref:Uncharacterized protein n=1 Tax=Phlebia brevispora TaxID=194682 RepID=A0ACC1S031_9APHY|nr:hypothetical protein NM688_g7888 [Phlebia brevispora]